MSKSVLYLSRCWPRGLIVAGLVHQQRKSATQKYRHAVAWSNHHSPEATRIKMEMERSMRNGDPPTNKLEANWRERMEDMVWALVNSPEFVFVP